MENLNSSSYFTPTIAPVTHRSPGNLGHEGASELVTTVALRSSQRHLAAGVGVWRKRRYPLQHCSES